VEDKEGSVLEDGATWKRNFLPPSPYTVRSDSVCYGPPRVTHEGWKAPCSSPPQLSRACLRAEVARRGLSFTAAPSRTRVLATHLLYLAMTRTTSTCLFTVWHAHALEERMEASTWRRAGRRDILHSCVLNQPACSRGNMRPSDINLSEEAPSKRYLHYSCRNLIEMAVSPLTSTELYQAACATPHSTAARGVAYKASTSRLSVPRPYRLWKNLYSGEGWRIRA